MVRWFVWGLAAIAVVVLALLGYARWTYGGGEPYPDLSTAARYGADALEAVVVSDQPIGNVAVSPEGRIFYTIHPESNPVGPVLYEWVEGAPVPYPFADQDELFASPLGVVVDEQNRLWVIDPADHGAGQPRLTGIDLATDRVVRSFDFDRSIAPQGSFLQDFQIDPSGTFAYIADVGFWNRRSGIVALNLETGAVRRVLDRHESVQPQKWLIRTPIRTMSYFGGMLSLLTGVDGIALSRDGSWLYYGAMTHDTMYRLPASVLNDFASSDDEITASIEALGPKPLNDGLSIDTAGNLYITDVEHQGVMVMYPDGRLETLIEDERVRWADSLSFGPDGYLYLADSAIPHLALQGQDHIESQAPYYIWRFRPEGTAPAGQ